MTEAQFQKQVIDYARLRGWLVAHFQKVKDHRGYWRTPVAADGKGFPDLVLVREFVLFLEVKTDTGRLSKEQDYWLTRLACADAVAHVVTPKNWEQIRLILDNPSRWQNCKG